MSQVFAMSAYSTAYPGKCLNWDQAEAYLSDLKARSSSSETVAIYRRNLKHFFQFLPPDGRIQRDTVARWRDYLLENGYKPRTVNLRLSAVNGFLGYLDLRDYQSPEHFKELDDEAQPVLTRNEYLQLLLAARAAGDERTYLMIKVLAITGLGVSDMDKLTVESVREGQIQVDASHTLKIPALLNDELAHFIRQEGIGEGALFVNRYGEPVRRTSVTKSIQSLADDAKLPQAKCNPRCLHKLYQATQEEIREEVSRLAEQMHERLLAQEQIVIGWQGASC